ncbi:efflux RND transporter periplasmic adaptor subunit [Niallia circulans]|nr:efflux RND transporter periplasmic adaptor subunit [Niallia circulans]
MKKSIKKWVVSGAIVVVIGGGFGSYFYFNKNETQQVSAQATTQTATAEVGDVEIKVSGTGSISAINKEAVTSTGNATVDEVNVAVGDEVEEGDELVTFEDDSIDPITASFSGEITALNVEEGDTVSMGTEVLTETDYDNLEMVVNVDELDISKVKEGQDATITVSALDDKEFTGEVTSVAKEAASSEGSSVAKYEVTVKVKKPSGLLVGMTAEATITTSSKSDVVTVPVEAVQKEDDEYYVLVPSGSTTSEDGSTETATTKQTVEVGLENEDVAEITGGLEEGTTVVLPTFESSNDSSSQGMMPGGDGMPSGGQMPSGGGMPSGGFSGGGNR